MSYLEKLFPSTSLNSTMPPTRTSSNPNTQKRAPFKAPSRVATGDKPTNATKAKAPAASKAKSGFQSAKAIELSDDAKSDDGDSEDEVPVRQPVKSKAKGKAPAKAPAIKEKDSDIDMDSDAVSEDEPPAPPARKVTKERKLDPAMPIPPKLLTRILWEGFEDKDMKIGKEAMSVVGKYVETFVREAVARAIFESRSDEGEIELGDGFLQVFLLIIIVVLQLLTCIGRGLGETCAAAAVGFLKDATIHQEPPYYTRIIRCVLST